MGAMLAKRVEDGRAKVAGDARRLPAWMATLHDVIARQTASGGTACDRLHEQWLNRR